jgi:hypothetical protein
MIVVRCAAAGCSATTPPIVAAARWLAIDYCGCRAVVCSHDCAAAVLAELVTVGGLPRRPSPGPFDPAGERLAEVTARRHHGMTAVGR